MIKDVFMTTASLPPRILVHAQEGVGKTTLAAKFPDPVFIQTEDGCPSNLSIPTFGLLTDFNQVSTALKALATEEHPYRALAFDSLDPLEGQIWRAVCRQHGWASIESPGYGKGYVTADPYWNDFLAALEYLRRERKMIIVLIAHSAIEIVNDPRAASYTSYQLRLHKRARGLIQDWCDAIGFLTADLHVREDDAGFGKKRARADGGSQRWLHWESRPSFVAKNRFGLPAKMPVPVNFDYSALAEYFPVLPGVSAATQIDTEKGNDHVDGTS
jgi:hypothetical protein